jgi:hypothetical protein
MFSPKGITNHRRRLQKKVKTGANKKIKTLALLGIIISFKNNFKPSAIGCKKPKNPTIFGPLLL